MKRLSDILSGRNGKKKEPISLEGRGHTAANYNTPDNRIHKRNTLAQGPSNSSEGSAIALYRKGQKLMNQERFQDAEPVLQDAYSLLKVELGNDHTETINCRREFAVSLCRQNKFLDAELHFREIYQYWRSRFGDGHEVILGAQTDLAWVLYYLKNFMEAETLFQQAYQQYQSARGDSDAEALYAGRGLGWTLYRLNKHSEAEACFQQVYERCQSIFGDNHKATLDTGNGFAWTLYCLNKYSEAEAYFQQVYWGHQSIYGDNNVKTLHAGRGLASTILKLKRFEESYAHFQHLSPAHEKGYGKEHSATIEIHHLLSDCLMELCKYQDAERVLESLLEVESRKFGKNDRKTNETRELLKRARDSQYQAVTGRLDATKLQLGPIAGGPNQDGPTMAARAVTLDSAEERERTPIERKMPHNVEWELSEVIGLPEKERDDQLSYKEQERDCIPVPLHGQRHTKVEETKSLAEASTTQDIEELTLRPEVKESQRIQPISKEEPGSEQSLVRALNEDATEREMEETFRTEEERRDKHAGSTLLFENSELRGNKFNVQDAQQQTAHHGGKEDLAPTLNRILSSDLLENEPNSTVYLRHSFTQRHGGRSETLSAFFSDSRAPHTSYSDVEVHKILSLLQRQNQDWSKVPRLYIVLRTIDELELLDDLIDLGVNDYWFPFTERKLRFIPSPRVRSNFLSAQSLVLTKSLDLEKGTKGEHGYFEQDEPLPFKVAKRLGSGSGGKVYKVISIISQKEYAEKRVQQSMDLRNGLNAKALQSLVAEIRTLKSIKHEHFIELVGSYSNSSYLGLIMSPVAEMDLEVYLTDMVAVKNDELRSFYGCLATGLAFLHKKNIRHKDIKPSNFLVNFGKILFTDFGLAVDYDDENSGITIGTVQAFTPKYCSPEVALRQPRNFSSDIWSLGLVFLEMATVLKGKNISYVDDFFESHGSRRRLVRDNKEALREIITDLKGEGEQRDNCSLAWIQVMLSVEPNRRPRADELLERIILTTEDERDTEFCGKCCQPKW